MKAKDFLPEDKFGTNPKRPARAGSRPPRKHDDRTKQIHQLHGATGWDVSHLELLKPDELFDLHQKHVDQKVAEVTGDVKFDKMLKGITGKKEVAKQQKADTKQQARDAFGSMFGGGNPADKLKIKEQGVAEGDEQFCENCGGSLAENGKASRALCVSGRPDNDLGASNLASCKSQGLRARDGEKSHKLGKTAKSRIKVGGHRIKGNKYGGPLPDWS